MAAIGRLKYTCKEPNCKNKFYTNVQDPNYKNKMFFRFPSDTVRALKWAKFVHVKSKPRILDWYWVLCQDHFKDSDFTSPMKLSLKTDAVPTIHAAKQNDNLSNYVQNTMDTEELNKILEDGLSPTKCTGPDIIEPEEERHKDNSIDLIESTNPLSLIQYMDEDIKRMALEDAPYIQENIKLFYEPDNIAHLVKNTSSVRKKIKRTAASQINSAADAPASSNSKPKLPCANRKIYSATQANSKLLAKNERTPEKSSLKTKKCANISDLNTSTCRICLTQNGSESIFDDKHENLSLRQLLEECVPIKVDKQDIMKLICTSCKKELIQTYTFIKKCLKSDKYITLCKEKSSGVAEIQTIEASQADEDSSNDFVCKIEVNEIDIKMESSDAFDNDCNTETENDIKIESPDAFDNDCNTETGLAEDRTSNCTTDPTINTVPAIEEANNGNTYSVEERKDKSQMNVKLRKDRRKKFYFVNESNQAILETVRTTNILANLKRRFPNALIQIQKFDPVTSGMQGYIRKRMKKKDDTTCLQCNITFESKMAYWKHCTANNHFPVYVCPTCNKVFRKRFSLANHLRTHSKEKPFMCDRCGICFRYRNNLLLHIEHIHEKKAMETTECPVCNKSFRKDRIAKHVKMHMQSKSYCCEMCGLVFRTLANLKQHQKTHLIVKPYTCVICKKGVVSKYQLEEHMTKHTNERKHECNICGVSFKRRLNLKTHNRKLHEDMTNSDEKENQSDLECKMCNFKCDKKLILKLHMRKNHQVYLCHICGLSFQNYRGLTQHKIKHRAMKHECQYCEKKFRQLAHYEIHLAIHTGDRKYGCEICGKRFTQQPHLKSHLLTHTGGKPHKCQYCEKAFAHLTSLVVHERNHTGERPYVCSECGKGFGHLTNYKKHVFAKHGITVKPKKPAYKNVKVEKHCEPIEPSVFVDVKSEECGDGDLVESIDIPTGEICQSGDGNCELAIEDYYEVVIEDYSEVVTEESDEAISHILLNY